MDINDDGFVALVMVGVMALFGVFCLFLVGVTEDKPMYVGYSTGICGFVTGISLWIKARGVTLV